ncbi:Whirlin [Holothuria leucospilota]|uniref:Whirlin n=1 Tax=Holothuria leucospilota TaxID=206669 RepID=A0A9Q1CJT1_HOLLE|nr:Whirlin [Holothuria leucospilota]
MASSSAAHKLRTLAHKTMSEEECAFLKVTIRRFRETHSVLGLCISLKKIIDTPERIQLLPFINAMIPPHLQKDFDKLCQLQFKCYPQNLSKVIDTDIPESKHRQTRQRSNINKSGEVRLTIPVEEFKNSGSRTRPKPSDDLADCLNRTLSRRKNSCNSRESRDGLHKRSKTYHASPSSSPGEAESTDSSKRELIQKLLDSTSEMTVTSEPELLLGEGTLPKGKAVRKVVLSRRQGESLGFSIRGGKDLKAGIFISEVDPGGQADKKGLKVGERILKVNDEVFKDITHAQAVVCLKSAQQLTMFVAPLGQMPGGTPDSTPRSTCPSHGTVSSHGSRYSSRESLPLKEVDSPQKITIMADEDGWLGFSIRGGIDQGTEPCVAHVDPLSPASRAGLQRGMKIEKVNETVVSGMNHLDMVQLVTVSRVVVLHVTQGDITPRRSIHNQDIPGPSQPSSKGNFSSKPVISDQFTDESFIKNLEFAPPMYSSTPLPPAGHPLLLNNRKNFLQKLIRKPLSDPDTTIVQVIREDAKNLPSKSNKKIKKKKKEKSQKQNQSGSSVEYGTPMEESGTAKLDGGTIRLNLGNPIPGDSGNFRDSKQIGDKTRMHVKDIFMEPMSEEADNNTNVLSTPVMSQKHGQWAFGRQSFSPLSPSSAELKDARSEVARQLRGELTGKKHPIPFTPNVPPSPASGNNQSSSPVVSSMSRIFNKVTRRSLGEELAVGSMIGSDSISNNSSGFHKQMDEGAMMSSPYDMMSDSKLVSNESAKVKVWSGMLC